MSDDSVVTIRGIFASRETADLAIEHLVQGIGLDRSDIFVQADGASNTSGEADEEPVVELAEESALAPQLNGGIEVSADLASRFRSKAVDAFNEAGATEVTIT